MHPLNWFWDVALCSVQFAKTGLYLILSLLPKGVQDTISVEVVLLASANIQPKCRTATMLVASRWYCLWRRMWLELDSLIATT